MNFTDFAADILLAPYGMNHRDLPPRVEDTVPLPVHNGDYELLNTRTEEVENTQFLTLHEACARNAELANESDDRRWIPAVD